MKKYYHFRVEILLLLQISCGYLCEDLLWQSAKKYPWPCSVPKIYNGKKRKTIWKKKCSQCERFVGEAIGLKLFSKLLCVSGQSTE